MRFYKALLIPHFINSALVLLFGIFFSIFVKTSVLVAIFATLSAICVFYLSNIVQWYVYHRHDNCKNTARSVIYDAIYGLILKYLIMIFLLALYLKKVNILENLFIIDFVLLIIIKNLLNNLFYRSYK